MRVDHEIRAAIPLPTCTCKGTCQAVTGMINAVSFLWPHVYLLVLSCIQFSQALCCSLGGKLTLVTQPAID